MPRRRVRNTHAKEQIRGVSAKKIDRVNQWIDRAASEMPRLRHRQVGHDPMEVARHFGEGEIDPEALAVAVVHVDLDR